MHGLYQSSPEYASSVWDPYLNKAILAMKWFKDEQFVG